jgi:hypothetical protein
VRYPTPPNNADIADALSSSQHHPSDTLGTLTL